MIIASEIIPKRCYDGEYAFVAHALQCSKHAVRLVATGKRGKRNTPLQQAINQALIKRKELDNAFVTYCRTLQKR